MQQLVLLAVPALVLCCLSTPAGAAASTPPLECSAVEEQPSWPIFHAMNNVTRDPASGKLVMEKLNDANAIGYYKGIYHVMMQVRALSSPAVATHACASAQQISHAARRRAADESLISSLKCRRAAATGHTWSQTT